MGRFRDKLKKRITLGDLKTQGQQTMALYQILGNALLDLVDGIEGGQIKGGVKIVSYDPFTIEWWMDIPEVPDSEEKKDERDETRMADE